MPSIDPIIQTSPFGKLPDGSPAQLFTISAPEGGLRATFTDYGATLVSLEVPDKHGTLADIALGYDSVNGYVTGKSYFGATVGRFANRIAAGRFTLDGIMYQLPLNDGPNHLHGGPHGFSHRLWKTETQIADSAAQIRFTLASRDGEEGYPGNMHVEVTYTVDPEQGTVRLDYRATTDQPTPVNLTNHAYFNLRGHAAGGDILDHVVTIHADTFLPSDAELIPTGKVRAVATTPLDFQTPHEIGERIGAPDEQLKLAGGYDHCFVLPSNTATARALTPAAQVLERTSGRVITVSTTEPAMQFYTGNFLDGTEVGKGGHHYPFRGGFCLETQHFPDSPNHPSFPNTILHPGEKFESTTLYTFSVE